MNPPPGWSDSYTPWVANLSSQSGLSGFSSCPNPDERRAVLHHVREHLDRAAMAAQHVLFCGCQFVPRNEDGLVQAVRPA